MLSPKGDNEEFEFYLKFAKPLVLSLTDTGERVKAAAWIRKLRNDKSEGSIRTDYLKLLLFVLQRRRLFGPFAQIPNEDDPLERLPPDCTLQDMAKNFVEIDKQELRETLSKGGYGEWPPYTVACSPDLTEYAATQRIPNFGVQVFFAISKEPLSTWDNFEKAVIPKGIKIPSENNELKLQPESPGNISCFAPDGRPTTPGRKSSKSKSTLKLDRSGKGENFEWMDKLTTPDVNFEELQKDQDMSEAIGETRIPPTWGSNLINVREGSPERGVSRLPSLPYLTPPIKTYKDYMKSVGLHPLPFRPKLPEDSMRRTRTIYPITDLNRIPEHDIFEEEGDDGVFDLSVSLEELSDLAISITDVSEAYEGVASSPPRVDPSEFLQGSLSPEIDDRMVFSSSPVRTSRLQRKLNSSLELMKQKKKYPRTKLHVITELDVESPEKVPPRIPIQEIDLDISLPHIFKQVEPDAIIDFEDEPVYYDEEQDPAQFLQLDRLVSPPRPPQRSPPRSPKSTREMLDAEIEELENELFGAPVTPPRSHGARSPVLVPEELIPKSPKVINEDPFLRSIKQHKIRKQPPLQKPLRKKNARPFKSGSLHLVNKMKHIVEVDEPGASPREVVELIEEMEGGLGGTSFIEPDEAEFRWLREGEVQLPEGEASDPALWQPAAGQGWWSDNPDYMFGYSPPRALREEPSPADYQVWYDVPPTPPLFSRDARIREGPAGLRVYRPEEFGIEFYDEPRWIDAARYLRQTQMLSPRKDPREVDRHTLVISPIKSPKTRLSDIHMLPEEADFFFMEEEPDLADISLQDEDLVPMSRMEAIMEAIRIGYEGEEKFAEIPVLDGSPTRISELQESLSKNLAEDLEIVNAKLPVTTPQRSPSPKRPGRGLDWKTPSPLKKRKEDLGYYAAMGETDVLSESPPSMLVESPPSSPGSPGSPDEYWLPVCTGDVVDQMHSVSVPLDVLDEEEMPELVDEEGLPVGYSPPREFQASPKTTAWRQRVASHQPTAVKRKEMKIRPGTRSGKQYTVSKSREPASHLTHIREEGRSPVRPVRSAQLSAQVIEAISSLLLDDTEMPELFEDPPATTTHLKMPEPYTIRAAPAPTVDVNIDMADVGEVKSYTQSPTTLKGVRIMNQTVTSEDVLKNRKEWADVEKKIRAKRRGEEIMEDIRAHYGPMRPRPPRPPSPPHMLDESLPKNLPAPVTPEKLPPANWGWVTPPHLKKLEYVKPKLTTPGRLPLRSPPKPFTTDVTLAYESPPRLIQSPTGELDISPPSSPTGRYFLQEPYLQADQDVIDYVQALPSDIDLISEEAPELYSSPPRLEALSEQDEEAEDIMDAPSSLRTTSPKASPPMSPDMDDEELNAEIAELDRQILGAPESPPRSPETRAWRQAVQGTKAARIIPKESRKVFKVRPKPGRAYRVIGPKAPAKHLTAVKEKRDEILEADIEALEMEIFEDTISPPRCSRASRGRASFKRVVKSPPRPIRPSCPESPETPEHMRRAWRQAVELTDAADFVPEKDRRVFTVNPVPGKSYTVVGAKRPARHLTSLKEDFVKESKLQFPLFRVTPPRVFASPAPTSSRVASPRDRGLIPAVYANVPSSPVGQYVGFGIGSPIRFEHVPSRSAEPPISDLSPEYIRFKSKKALSRRRIDFDVEEDDEKPEETTEAEQSPIRAPSTPPLVGIPKGWNWRTPPQCTTGRWRGFYDIAEETEDILVESPPPIFYSPGYRPPPQSEQQSQPMALHTLSPDDRAPSPVDRLFALADTASLLDDEGMPNLLDEEMPDLDDEDVLDVDDGYVVESPKEFRASPEASAWRQKIESHQPTLVKRKTMRLRPGTRSGKQYEVTKSRGPASHLNYIQEEERSPDRPAAPFVFQRPVTTSPFQRPTSTSPLRRPTDDNAFLEDTEMPEFIEDQPSPPPIPAVHAMDSMPEPYVVRPPPPVDMNLGVGVVRKWSVPEGVLYIGDDVSGARVRAIRREQESLDRKIRAKKRGEELLQDIQAQYGPPRPRQPRPPRPPSPPHMLDEPLPEDLPAPVTPKKLPPPGWTWVTPPHLKKTEYVKPKLRTPGRLSPPKPFSTEVTLAYESPPRLVQSPTGELYLSPPSSSAISPTGQYVLQEPYLQATQDVIDYVQTLPGEIDLFSEEAPELYSSPPRLEALSEQDEEAEDIMDAPSSLRRTSPKASPPMSPEMDDEELNAEIAELERQILGAPEPLPRSPETRAWRQTVQGTKAARIIPKESRKVFKVRPKPGRAYRVIGPKAPEKHLTAVKEKEDKLLEADIAALEMEMLGDTISPPRSSRANRVRAPFKRVVKSPPRPIRPSSSESPETPEHMRRAWRQAVELTDAADFIPEKDRRVFTVRPAPGKSYKVVGAKRPARHLASLKEDSIKESKLQFPLFRVTPPRVFASPAPTSSRVASPRDRGLIPAVYANVPSSPVGQYVGFGIGSPIRFEHVPSRSAEPPISDLSPEYIRPRSKKALRRRRIDFDLDEEVEEYEEPAEVFEPELAAGQIIVDEDGQLIATPPKQVPYNWNWKTPSPFRPGMRGFYTPAPAARAENLGEESPPPMLYSPESLGAEPAILENVIDEVAEPAAAFEGDIAGHVSAILDTVNMLGNEEMPDFMDELDDEISAVSPPRVISPVPVPVHVPVSVPQSFIQRPRTPLSPRIFHPASPESPESEREAWKQKVASTRRRPLKSKKWVVRPKSGKSYIVTRSRKPAAHLTPFEEEKYEYESYMPKIQERMLLRSPQPSTSTLEVPTYVPVPYEQVAPPSLTTTDAFHPIMIRPAPYVVRAPIPLDTDLNIGSPKRYSKKRPIYSDYPIEEERLKKLQDENAMFTRAALNAARSRELRRDIQAQYGPSPERPRPPSPPPLPPNYILDEPLPEELPEAMKPVPYYWTWKTPPSLKRQQHKKAVIKTPRYISPPKEGLIIESPPLDMYSPVSSPEISPTGAAGVSGISGLPYPSVSRRSPARSPERSKARDLMELIEEVPNGELLDGGSPPPLYVSPTQIPLYVRPESPPEYLDRARQQELLLYGVEPIATPEHLKQRKREKRAKTPEDVLPTQPVSRSPFVPDDVSDEELAALEMEVFGEVVSTPPSFSRSPQSVARPAAPVPKHIRRITAQEAALAGPDYISPPTPRRMQHLFEVRSPTRFNPALLLANTPQSARMPVEDPFGLPELIRFEPSQAVRMPDERSPYYRSETPGMRYWNLSRTMPRKMEPRRLEYEEEIPLYMRYMQEEMQPELDMASPPASGPLDFMEESFPRMSIDPDEVDMLGDVEYEPRRLILYPDDDIPDYEVRPAFEGQPDTIFDTSLIEDELLDNERDFRWMDNANQNRFNDYRWGY